MKRANSHWRWGVLALSALLVAACGGSGPEDAATTVTESAAGASTSETVGDTSQTAAPVAVPGPGDPWDVLFLAEENWSFSPDAAQAYARRAGEALGVEVRFLDTSWLISWAWELLRQVRDEAYPGLGDMVREAEIIVVTAFAERSDNGDPTQIDRDDANCLWDTSAVNPRPPQVTTPEYWEPYRTLLDDLYTEIWALRDGAPTVLLTVDYHQPYYGRNVEAGIEAECRAWLEALSGVAREVGEAHGATFVSAYDVLNGPNHDLDPVALGYVGPSELKPSTYSNAPNEVGSEMVADAIASAGLEPTTRP